MARDRTTRHGGTLGQIELDLFWKDTLLEFAHLGMLSTASKGTGRFHVVVSYSLEMVVHNGVPVPKEDLVPAILVGLALGIGHGLSDNLLFVEMAADRFKVAFRKDLDLVSAAEDGPKVGKKVLLKDFGSLGVSQMQSIRIHGSIECGTVEGNGSSGSSH